MFAVNQLPPGHFTVSGVAPIGEGGLGFVDEVEVVATNGAHAVGTRLARKRLSDKWQGDPGARERFEREIDMMRTMHHPNIVPLEGVSVGSDRWYVMPRYPGSLRSALVAGRVYAGAVDVAAFGTKVAGALAYAHSLNFIHRDLKPENILLDRAGEPRVSDWGLGQFVHLHSKVLDLTRGGPMGTAYYCSLEQWSTGRCGVTGDIYSLGVLLAELAAGQALPINPAGGGIRVDVLSNLDLKSRSLNAIVKRMTATLASARHQSMYEVAIALRSVCA